MWTLSAFYIPPRHIRTLAIANRERVGLWSVTFSALQIKLCVASVFNRVIARKSGKFCSRPNSLDNLARKRMLRRADKGWSVGRWNERVRAERCEVVDWDQILNLQRSRTASWDYQGNIGKWDMTEFSNSSRKRGKSARASFILRITHHLKSGVLVSSPNIYLPCYAGYLQRILLNLSLQEVFFGSVASFAECRLFLWQNLGERTNRSGNWSLFTRAACERQFWRTTTDFTAPFVRHHSSTVIYAFSTSLRPVSPVEGSCLRDTRVKGVEPIGRLLDHVCQTCFALAFASLKNAPSPRTLRAWLPPKTLKNIPVTFLSRDPLTVNYLTQKVLHCLSRTHNAAINRLWTRPTHSQQLKPFLPAYNRTGTHRGSLARLTDQKVTDHESRIWNFHFSFRVT